MTDPREVRSMTEQLDLLSQEAPLEAALALLKRALTVAAEDGTYDLLSDQARRLIALAFLPPPGGVGGLIANLESEAAWAKAQDDASQRHLKRVAEIAATARHLMSLPPQRPHYNRHGHPTATTADDLDVIERIVLGINARSAA